MTNIKNKDKTQSNKGKTKSKLSRNDKKTFAKEFVNNDRNATQAYLKIRPNVKEKSAQVRGSQVLNDVIVQAEIRSIMDNLGITQKFILEGFKTAIESGLTKKATNRDAISGLKELAKISGMTEKTENEASERVHLESLSNEDLNTRLEELTNQIKDMRRDNAIEGEILD